ncbi:kinase-like domain-containing protein [Polychytrium aggregatum]|uniref:kinase-like domain-containing protein n=1 Tax=Polychytrium aggregatum TaxID=110093 RepID=UPI0022FDC7DF|nr:kinase-like domain-containing protein [Polychytrium aggregatum]KAI9190779.1 kinase-like domain-containing protein [Polychytrium aggregatum]
MVSPFMPNGTLLQYVSSPRRSCSIDEKLQLLYQVSSGMTYLHEEKLLHGDLKAQSVLLDESFRAVITDFGFAEANSAPELRAPRTVDHMAPEMLDDRRPCRPTAKTDIYAFAITMYEVLCSGGPIWVGRDGQVIDESQIALYCRRGQRPKRLDDVPDDIWMLMEECWRDNPSERLFFVEILVRLEDYRQ